MTLLVLMGPPASGKSTYAEELAQDGWRIVCPDVIRDRNGSDPGTDNLATFAAAYRITEAALRSGQRVVFDSTALTEHVRRSLRKLARRLGCEPHLAVIHTSNRTCLTRNRKRLRPVPEDQMRSMLVAYERQYPLTVRERWASVRVVDGTRKLVAS